MSTTEPTRFRVTKPGFLTTIQDLGRFGYQRYGMPVSGAMDAFALRVANRLVGNPDNSAVVEFTIQGADLFFETPAVIALTGGDLSPAVDGARIPSWTTVTVSQGSALTFGRRKSGARAYLAVSGGLDVPVTLGSRSTHLRSRTGGLNGRALRRDDVIMCGPSLRQDGAVEGRALPEKILPPYSPNATLRVVLGPQDDYFHQEALDRLITSRYTVSPQSDRMGYRLTGHPLAHAVSSECISDATPFGAIQVPANQQPILLMADRQTTGGYPKIGVVISADLPLAAQLLPGDTVCFSLVEAAEAQAITRVQLQALNRALPPMP